MGGGVGWGEEKGGRKEGESILGSLDRQSGEGGRGIKGRWEGGMSQDLDPNPDGTAKPVKRTMRDKLRAKTDDSP